MIEVFMGQVTLYLDEETETRLRKAAKQEGLSVSKWVGKLIRRKTSREWPQEIADFAGTWSDFPTVDELRRDTAEDSPREPL
jgi:hypothetical protein